MARATLEDAGICSSTPPCARSQARESGSEPRSRILMSSGSRAISGAYERVQRNDIKALDCRGSSTLMSWVQKAAAGVFLSAALLMTPTITAAVLLGVYETACSAPTQPPPESAAHAGTSNKSARNPFIIHNADGTFTIQKKPPNGPFKDSKAGSGLVIPPQVVVPLVPATGRKP